jgi:hypothetical protein
MKSQRGQVAIFVALIFQVLFVFFAMLVNVGLLVHHKINLQNSVDLAAYYGAMKQAEVLNAVGHINFQIRQSLKLMTFRYRHLGLFGDNDFPCKFGGCTDTDEASNFFPSFCLLYAPFSHTKPNENYCKTAGTNPQQTLTLPPLPDQGFAVIFGSNDAMRNVITAARDSIRRDCRSKNGISVAMLLLFARAYKIDVSHRKKLAVKLAQRISSGVDTMRDLDNEMVADGVRNTLVKNLTYQNKDTMVDATFLNGLALNNCGNTGDVNAPPRWLVERFFWPVYWSLLADCNQENELNYFTRPIFELTDIPSETFDSQFGQIIRDLFPYIQEPDGSIPARNYLKSTAGFEKNPWCMAYFGVRAKSKPQIPFSPFGTVTLEAKAFAKPFGGTIGPWSHSQWSNSDRMSRGGTEIDTVSPIRIEPGQTLDATQARDLRQTLDFPRYVGDRIGSKSKMVQTQLMKVWKNIPDPQANVNWWYHLLDPDNDLDAKDREGDFLAFSDSDIHGKMIRELELAFIQPDQFDVAYYSVEPDWYRNYFVRLKNQPFDFPVRGDLGSRHKDDSSEWAVRGMSVKDQIKRAMDKKIIDFDAKLTYIPDSFQQLLTSYKSEAPDNHVMDPAKFGRCSEPIPDGLPPEKATTGNCIVGGRLGYSVKIVDGSFLKEPQSLGGRGSAASVINNPPPDGF